MFVFHAGTSWGRLFRRRRLVYWELVLPPNCTVCTLAIWKLFCRYIIHARWSRHPSIECFTTRFIHYICLFASVLVRLMDFRDHFPEK